MRGGVRGGLDEGPAQVLGTVLGKRPPAILLPGLVDLRAQLAVAAELLGR